MATLLDPTSNEQKYSKLTSGVIVGSTTANSTRLWVRIYQPGKWSLVVTASPLSGDLVRLEEKTVPAFLAGNGIAAAYLGEHDFTHDNSLTHVFDIAGLNPDTRYYYAVIASEVDAGKVARRTEIGGDAPRHFRTMPESPSEIVFGFYSCHDHISNNGSAGAWPHYLEQLGDTRAHFSIGGGDQVYVDTNGKNRFLDIWSWLKDNKKALLDKFALGKGKYDEAGIQQYLLDIYRWYYRVYWSVPELRSVFEQVPQYMIWDDHEIMDGWGSLTWKERAAQICSFWEEEDSKPNLMLLQLMWKAACQAYYEYEHSHNPATSYNAADPDQCQWDYAFRHGGAAFYVLDMRGHHDVEKNKGKKIPDKNILLGQAQFDRFRQWLGSEDVKQANALFIVSPVPVVHWVDRLVNYADLGEAKDDFKDEWGHETNQWERNQLLETLFKSIDQTGKKVVFLSGDVHCASIFRIRHRKFPAAKVYHATSSAISRKPAPKLSLIGISSGGAMENNDNVFTERLYALTGSNNFLMVRARPGANPEIVIELNWAGGDEGEITKRRIVLD